jgi:hypothetical protein
VFTSSASATIIVTNADTNTIYLNSSRPLWSKNNEYRSSQDIYTSLETWNYLKLRVGFPTSGWTEPAPPDTVRAYLYGYSTDSVESGGSTETVLLSSEYIDLSDPDSNVFLWNFERLVVQTMSDAVSATDDVAGYKAYRIHFEAKNTAATVHQIIGITDLLALNSYTKDILSSKLIDGVKDNSSHLTFKRYYLIVRWIEQGVPTPPDLNYFYINDVDPVAPDGIDMSQYDKWLTSAEISELRDDGQACLKNISDIIKLDTTTPLSQITYKYEDGHSETMYAIRLHKTVLFGNEYAVAMKYPPI